MEILKEARRLYDLGFGVHWIRPGSKAPVKAGWSGGKRDNWETLQREYEVGMGLGVRLGAPSKLPHGYLANIDIDIKSKDPRHIDEARAFVKKRFPDIIGKAPIVITGYGFRLFVVTKEPVKSQKLTSSNETTKVYLPTALVNRRQMAAVEEGQLTQDELERGYRMRPAWEVEFMSEGKQVVLPPSIHPELKRPYRWGDRQIAAVDDIPWAEVAPAGSDASESLKTRHMLERTFKPLEVVELDGRLSQRMQDSIISGKDVIDRSAALYGATIAMLKAGFTDQEILSVLTEPGFALGEAAYEHRQTRNRFVAAAWVHDYTLVKAKQVLSAESVFKEKVSVSPTLEDQDAIEGQLLELGAKPEVDGVDWEDWLERSGRNGDGPPKPTLKNVKLILTHAVPENLFRRNDFSYAYVYGDRPPWMDCARGGGLSDEDYIEIKLWLSQKYRVEPSTQTIFEAVTAIAVRNSFHPVQVELESLPPWDGVPRLDDWLRRHFEAKGDAGYLGDVFRKWMVAAVARVYEPGVKFDWMPIFEGRQGTGKSSFGAILFGQAYFVDWLPNLADKDAAQQIRHARCIEFSELDSLSRNETETVKSFLSRQVDTYRPAFERTVKIYPRQCVFFGTTNRGEFLQDDTGNRRFNPIEVGQLDFEALARDKDQLWAEAYFIYINGIEDSLDLTGTSAKIAEWIRGDKLVTGLSDVLAEQIADHMERQRRMAPTEGEIERVDYEKGFRLSDLYSEVGPFRGQKLDNWKLRQTSKALKQLGFNLVKIDGYRHYRMKVTE